MKISELMRLDKKISLVAGGAGLLGSAMSEALAEVGSNVVIASRNLDSCKSECEKLKEAYPVQEFYPVQLDISSPESILNCIENITQNIGEIDVLVTCAWSGRKNTWDSINDEDWDNDIEICLNGVFRLIKASTESLKKTKGVILTVGSMYGHVAPDYRLYEGVPQANPPSYGAAKAGIIQLTKYLSSFLAPHGIRANCISPGPFPYEETINQFPEFKTRLCNKNPLGRLGKAHEIKGAVVLLCTDASTYITGQNICVDGGWTIW